MRTSFVVPLSAEFNQPLHTEEVSVWNPTLAMDAKVGFLCLRAEQGREYMICDECQIAFKENLPRQSIAKVLLIQWLVYRVIGKTYLLLTVLLQRVWCERRLMKPKRAWDNIATICQGCNKTTLCNSHRYCVSEILTDPIADAIILCRHNPFLCARVLLSRHTLLT